MTNKTLWGIFGLIILGVALMFSGKMFETVGAGEIAIFQDPVDGEFHVYSQPGIYWQNWGTVTHYKKSSQIWFSDKEGEGKENEGSIKVRFNDGGHAQLSGSIRVDLPQDEASILALHTRYGNQTNLEHQLVKQIMTKAVYMTGPMMSSKESYAERRNDLISYIEDQAINGIYKTEVINMKVKDPMDTSSERTVAFIKPVLGQGGIPLVQEASPAKQFNLRLYNLTINSIDYDATVEKQIASQQQAIMQVQTAIANAKRAEQEKFTVEQQGAADAAKTKWEQEAKNAQIIAEADGRRRSAEQDALAAEQEKRANILRGQGEAERKKLVMQANGALEQKLETYLETQKVWAEALSKYQGAIVPQIQTGGSTTSNGALNFAELMSMKAARDLSLDLKNK